MNKIIDKSLIYLKLMRLDKPIGTLLLLWPTLWALFLAAQGMPSFSILILFIIGTFLMRSAGCVINDFADRKIDIAVERTQNRPFAQGKVSAKEAIILCIILCFLALLCLIPMNRLTQILSIPAVFLALSYPFTKRFFPIPQLYLGIAFSFGIPMAYAAQSGDLPAHLWLLFLANLSWTVAYDTIYAIADKPDDLKIGIHTSAITFGKYDAEWAMAFHFLFSMLMLIFGLIIHAGFIYWLGLIIVILLQIAQYPAIKTRDRTRCFQTFLKNNRIGIIWLIAIIIESTI